PEFNDRYRRRLDETPVDNLCGLWSIGPSTFYRYLDKGKRQLAELIAAPMTGARTMSLRTLVQEHIDAQHREHAGTDKADWHRQQAERAHSQRDPCSALWHLMQAGDTRGFIAALQRSRIEIASNAETDVLIELFASRSLDARQTF